MSRLQACRQQYSTILAVQGQPEVSQAQPQGQASRQPPEQQASQQPGQSSEHSPQEDEDDEDRDFHRCSLTTTLDLRLFQMLASRISKHRMDWAGF